MYKYSVVGVIVNFGEILIYRSLFFNGKMTDENNSSNQSHHKVRVWVDGW